MGSSAFEVLYVRNRRYVRSVLAGLGVPGRDLDDLCHDVFVVALRKVEETPVQPGTERFWLRQIGYYLASGYRHRAVRRLETLVDEPADVQSCAAPDQDLIELELTDILGVAFAGLSNCDSDLLALHVVGDLSFRTLGEILACDPKTARRRFLTALQRARVAIRDNQTPSFPRRFT